MIPADVRAVVSGGASGLGLATARRIVSDGGKVVLLDLNDEKGQAAAAELGAAAHYLHLDVTDEAATAAALMQAQERMGGLNAAISCAGILGAGRALGREGAMPLALSGWLMASAQFVEWIEQPYTSDADLLMALCKARASLPASC